jgi:hypothetical protein
MFVGINMMKKCRFCGEERDLTKHEIMAQSYGGKREDAANVIPDICRECHNQLENNMNKARASAGAGKNIPQFQSFLIGSVDAHLQTGSVYLGNNGVGHIDAGSPIYGMRCHNKVTGEQFIESALSGGSVVLITGSPANSWTIYSIAKGK